MPTFLTAHFASLRRFFTIVEMAISFICELKKENTEYRHLFYYSNTALWSCVLHKNILEVISLPKRVTYMFFNFINILNKTVQKCFYKSFEIFYLLVLYSKIQNRASKQAKAVVIPSTSFNVSLCLHIHSASCYTTLYAVQWPSLLLRHFFSIA